MPTPTWKQLQQELEEKQTGEVTPDSSSPSLSDIEYVNRIVRADRSTDPNTSLAIINAYQDAAIAAMQDRSDEAVALGYGEGRRDYEIPYDIFAEDPNEARAQRQTQASKVVNGILKAVPYAATTFLDNTVGLFAGLFNVAADLADEGEFHPMDSFISNPFAESMQAVRDWSEKYLPNYRTAEETENADEWWNYMNGNFWGDVFLKNLGFTIGAMASGLAWSKAFQAMTAPMMKNAYTAALAAAGGDAEAEAVFQSILRGETMKNPKQIYDAFENLVNTQKKLGVINTIVGGAGGAIGESRVEALNAAKEYRENQNQLALDEFYRKRSELIDTISKSELLSNNGIMTQAGRQFYDEKMADFTKDYENKLKSIDELANGVANTTFWLNMPVLTASNMIMGARMFAGGFDTQAKNLVRGTMGNYRPGTSFLRGAGKAAGNTLTEGTEELTQKVISEGAKDIADARIGTFTNGKYDMDSIRSVSEWLGSMLESAGQVLVDPKSWEEFAVGAMTGALGGGPARGGGWSGGVIGGFQEGFGTRASRAEDQAAIEAVNSRINNPEFKALWNGLVRHNYYENIKDKALNDDQRFIWHGAKDAQVINDVMMFADIGRLRDLERYVDEFDNIDNVSPEELQQIRELAANELKTDISNVSDSQLRGWIHNRAAEVKKAINQYRSFYDTIDYMSLGTSDPEVIKEMIYTQSQLQNAEDRYNEILDGVLANLRPQLENTARETKADGMPTARAEKAKRLLASEHNLRTLFGGRALDIQGREDTPAGQMAQMVDDATQDAAISLLEELDAFTDKPELRRDIDDLQKLVRSRQKYYSALFDPTNRRRLVDEVRSNARTNDSVVEELQNSEREKAVDKAIDQLSAATSLQDFHRIFDEIDQSTTDDDKTYEMLQERIQADPKLKAFDDATRDAQSFVDDIKSSVDDEMSDADPSVIASLSTLQNFLRDFDIIDLIKEMPEGMSVEEAIASAILGTVGESDPVAAKLALGILEEKLSDKEVADRMSGLLGSIAPGSGEGEGGGTGAGADTGGEAGGGADTGGGVSMFDVAKAAVRIANSVDDENLNALASGDFSKFPGLTEDLMSEISNLANNKLDELKRRRGFESTDTGVNPDPSTRENELDENDPRRVARHAEYLQRVGGSIPGNMLSIYDEKALKEGRTEQNQKKGLENSVAKLIHYKSQQFVDSGALFALDAAYREKNRREKGLADEGVPVYFIGNPHYIPNNYQNNPFASKSGSVETMLAIEIDDEARAILKKAGKESVISDDRLIDIDGKKYQLIGQLWAPHKNYVDARPENEKPVYAGIRKHAQDIWQMAMGNSVIQQYKSEVDKSGMGVNGFPVEGKWYVAKSHPTADTQKTDTHEPDWTTGERIFTTLDYIMSGRNITGDRDELGAYRKYDLKSSLKGYSDAGGKFYFAMPTVSDDIVYSVGTPVKSLDVSVNAPLGSLWIATQEPNGAWAWSYVSIARTGEYDFVNNQDTKFIKEMDKRISALFVDRNPDITQEERAADFSNRLRWIHELKNYIYFGENNTVSIRFDSAGHPIVYVGDRECVNKEQFYSALKDGNFRFQVSSDSLGKNPESGVFMYDLMEAGVLQSEMMGFTRRGASFAVNIMYDEDSTGNKVAPYHASRPGKGAIAWTPGANPAASYAATTGSKIRNIRIGSVGYQYDPETGEVQYMARGYRDGMPVENAALRAQVIALGDLLAIKGPGGTLVGDYDGKRWQINDKNHMFVNMFETEIGGITVRMVQRGTNGAIMLISDNSEWESLLEIAEEVKPKKYTPEAGAGNPQMSDEDILREHDRIADEEGVGNPAGEESPQSGRRSSNPPVQKIGGSNSSLFLDDSDDGDLIWTAPEEERKEAEHKDDYNCGDGGSQ